MTHMQTTMAVDATTGTAITISNDCVAPTWEVGILSVAMLEEQGAEVTFGAHPRITVGNSVITVHKAQNLYYVDLYANGAGAVDQPHAGHATAAPAIKPSTGPLDDKIDIDLFEPFAGGGALSHAFRQQ